MNPEQILLFETSHTKGRDNNQHEQYSKRKNSRSNRKSARRLSQ